MTFESFPLSPSIQDALRALEYTTPTPIQAQALPTILEGKDLIALAETGSGKTAACAIPLCEKVDPTSPKIQALIVVPTRELALQYSTETQKIGKIKDVRAFAMFGGEDMDLQRAKLKHGVQILIATPGRLIDFIYARAIDLTQVATIVLDEADQMLGMGFVEDLEFIIQCLVHDHQTLLFSATMPKEIKTIAQHHMKDPQEIRLISDEVTPASLSHEFFYCANPRNKTPDLLDLLKKLDPAQCIIFAGSRIETERLTRELKKSLSSVDFLHGGLSQSLRTVITQKFLKKKIRYLVATDVAARGLDFSGVTHVIHYHLPKDKETYLHRSGRTGRRGREGVSLALVTQRDLGQLGRLLTHLKREAKWIGNPPSERSRQEAPSNRRNGPRGPRKRS